MLTGWTDATSARAESAATAVGDSFAENALTVRAYRKNTCPPRDFASRMAPSCDRSAAVTADRCWAGLTAVLTCAASAGAFITTKYRLKPLVARMAGV